MITSKQNSREMNLWKIHLVSKNSYITTQSSGLLISVESDVSFACFFEVSKHKSNNMILKVVPRMDSFVRKKVPHSPSAKRKNTEGYEARVSLVDLV